MKSRGMVGNCFWQLFDIVWLIFLVRQINSSATVDLCSQCMPSKGLFLKLKKYMHKYFYIATF